MGPLHAPPIAVVGFAGRLPGAGDVEQFWANLLAGVDSIERPDLGADPVPAGPGGFVHAVGKVDGIEDFDAGYFRIPPAEAVVMDPQHRVLLEVATSALEHAGHHARRDAVVGVFAGCGENFYLREFVGDGEHVGPVGTDPKVLAGNAADFLTARIAFKLGLSGPSVTVQTTCATSLTAVALACAALAAGDCDIALAGGVSLLMPDTTGYTFTNGGIFSDDGTCRPFDARASGTVPSSGAAMVVLRRDDDAAADGDTRHALLTGWAVGNDGGGGAGFTAPSPAGQERVIRRAQARAGVEPADVGFVETHGTGTALGDPIEFEALHRVFGNGRASGAPTVLGAVKANIGHTDAAAGVSGLIKTVLAVQRGVIPGTAHFRQPNPALDLVSSPFSISAEPVAWDSAPRPRVAGVSAFGLGGNDVHVIVRQAVPGPRRPAVRPDAVVVLSARAPEDLARVTEQLAAWTEARPELDDAGLADLAYTLAVGRPQFRYRWSAAVRDRAELSARLRESAGPVAGTRRFSMTTTGSTTDLVALGRRLVADEPLFRAQLERLCPSGGLEDRPEPAAAALVGVTVAETLAHVGIEFGRVDVPPWASGVLAAWASRDPAVLEEALRACRPEPSAATRTDPGRRGAGQLVVDGGFRLGDAVARAWMLGASVDWDRWFAEEDRCRVPAPTYPFARQRFWLERRSPDVATTEPRPPRQPAAGDVQGRVAAIWQAVLGVDTVAPDANFADDLDGDSLYAVEIGAQLCDEFGLELPVDLPFIAPTVAQSARFVEDALAQRSS